MKGLGFRGKPRTKNQIPKKNLRTRLVSFAFGCSWSLFFFFLCIFAGFWWFPFVNFNQNQNTKHHPRKLPNRTGCQQSPKQKQKSQTSRQISNSSFFLLWFFLKLAWLCGFGWASLHSNPTKCKTQLEEEAKTQGLPAGPKPKTEQPTVRRESENSSLLFSLRVWFFGRWFWGPC